MVGEKIVTEGEDVSDEKIEKEICKQLGLPEPDKKGLLGQLFGK
jgi:hypothetical protein